MRDALVRTKFAAILSSLLLFSNFALAEVGLDIGPTFLSDDYSYGAMIAVYNRFESVNIDVGLIHTTEQAVNTCGRPDCLFQIPRQLFLFAEYVLRADEMDRWYKRFEVGIGPAYTEQIECPTFNQCPGRISSNKLRVSTHAAFWFTDNTKLIFRHISDSGAGNGYNLGQDAYPMIGIQTRF